MQFIKIYSYRSCDFRYLYTTILMLNLPIDQVTCLAWVPCSTQLFMVSHSSGQLYLYKSDLPPSPQAPHYQLFKAGPGFTVHTCRSKQTRNPLFRWVIGEGSINEFAFSPGEGRYLATVCYYCVVSATMLMMVLDDNDDD